MRALTLRENASVVVVDDDPEDAGTAGRILRANGFRATTITDFDPDQDCVEFLNTLEQFDALVSDHVLQGKRRPPFTGAELVSTANRRRGKDFPAVLISSHINTDQGGIRRWREGIPRVVDKAVLMEKLVDAIDYTLAEANGRIEDERRAFGTPIEVLDVLEDNPVPTAKVVVVGWRINTSVHMPLDPIIKSTGISVENLRGVWLRAEVNCHARSADDLFYRNITVAPPLPEGWMEG